MSIIVILCTYNRGKSLAKTLESIALSELDEPDAWEVLVVDNNSTDDTRDVVEDFCRRYPNRFRYLFERQQGKSHALNAGIRAARGDILAFTDDDTIVDPHWLENLTTKLQDGEFAGAAGRVIRTWTRQPPHWLSLKRPYEKMAFALVSFELDQDAGELLPGFQPVGANMAFRKEVFMRHGGFRTDLGPQGNETEGSPGPEARHSAAMGGRRRQATAHFHMWEDTELGERLMSRGERIRYEPSAVVYHPVSEGRLTKEYFLAWWFSRGRDVVRIVPDRGPVCGIPRRYVRMARFTARLLWMSLGWLLAFKPHQRFYCKLMAWEMAGAMLGGYEHWFGTRIGGEVSAKPRPEHASDLRSDSSTNSFASQAHRR